MKNKQEPTQPRESAPDTEPMHARLRALIEEALRAQPFAAHTPVGFQEPTAMVPRSIVKSAAAVLSTENLPALFDQRGKLIRTPTAAPAATSIRLEAGVIANSRVAAAGSHVIIYPEQSRALATGLTGVVAMEGKPGSFRTIEAAEFSTVADDADVSVSAMPVSAADIDMSQAIAKGFRIELPRSERKDVDAELLCAEIVAALVLRLGRAADSVLLAAIAAATPATFSLASAAARGLTFDELRGFVGTAANGATISEDGTLRAGGIPAELTADSALTIVGAFNRAAVAIHESVDIHFQRTNRNGDLAVTAFAHMLPLVPNVSAFWTVPAA